MSHPSSHLQTRQSPVAFETMNRRFRLAYVVLLCVSVPCAALWLFRPSLLRLGALKPRMDRSEDVVIFLKALGSENDPHLGEKLDQASKSVRDARSATA